MRKSVSAGEPRWTDFLCGKGSSQSKANAMNNLQVIPDFDFRQLVSAAEGEPVTDTFQIAKAFGKRHQHVIRALENLHCSTDFTKAHFWVVEKINELGIFDKKQKYYRMDFSGFVMLVMGFNGAKADAVKEAYINAFNWMTSELRKYSESYEAERNAVMLEYMKEKDVASMSGRLLNRWGRVKKPALLARIERIDQRGQISLPGVAKALQE
ncbi:putative Rha family transcriptional regulator [Hafnia phage vB_HpaM_Meifeng]|nr:putative Rha family transcriptional regulator [Hafnia phage vB_HpaM_Meifeng]